MKRSLKAELKQTLERNAYSLEDAAFAEMSTAEGETVCIAADRFLDMAADVEYEDGMDWFRLYEFPGMNPSLTQIGRSGLVFLSSERKGADYAV